MCGATGRMSVGISTTAELRSLTKGVLVCPSFIMSLVRRKDQTLAIALHTEVCLQVSLEFTMLLWSVGIEANALK